MIEQGYIKLHRSILKWEWYDDANTMRLFLHLLLTVNYEPKKWHGITIERGQRVCSIATLSKETRLSVQEVRTAINRLFSTGEITRSKYPQYTVITVQNYCAYQELTGSVTTEQQASNRLPTGHQQQCKKVKESNKKVKEIYPSDIELAELLTGLSDGIQKAVAEWLAYKRERKFEYQSTSLTALVKKVRKNVLEHNDTAVIDLVETCMSNGWQGIAWDKLGGKNATPIRGTNTSASSGKTTRPRFDFSNPDIPV